MDLLSDLWGWEAFKCSLTHYWMFSFRSFFSSQGLLPRISITKEIMLHFVISAGDESNLFSSSLHVQWLRRQMENIKQVGHQRPRATELPLRAPAASSHAHYVGVCLHGTQILVAFPPKDYPYESHISQIPSLCPSLGVSQWLCTLCSHMTYWQT